MSENPKSCFYLDRVYLRGETVMLTKASPYFPCADTATLNVYTPSINCKHEHYSKHMPRCKVHSAYCTSSIIHVM